MNINNIENTIDLRKKIIEKSSELFLTQGYNKTTVRKIADDCGIGRGHLYYYFKKKEDILLFIYRDFLEKIYEYINNNNDIGSNTMVRYAVSQYLYTYIIVSSHSLFRIYIEASKVDVIRKEYVSILIDLFNKKGLNKEFEFDEEDIYLSMTIGCAGESELLNRYYEKDCSLTLDDIVNSTIMTRLLLLNIDYNKINNIIEEAIKIINNLDLDNIKSISEIKTFWSKYIQ
ncbi:MULTISPECIES: TetR/AcrR family transcriptional regulator [unclassified Romboutsia]|uniref:TetR/AcrR family transcriptional regulator n=1 Tax=unclassified Romboutsia TaxID=2626894 RepID=UPI0008207ED1|nr:MULTISPECIES: TetR/AcrR family transcriptional regulator [unclassified Romboutsia]SCH32378.1 HTH-type transcriptional repressor KstR2 [uncultured Clostridium sp.]